MMKKSIVNLVLVLLIIGCNSILGLAQVPIDNDGKDFWIAWPYTNYNKAEVIIQSGSIANVAMSVPALLWIWSGVVLPGKPAIIILPISSKLRASTIENKEKKGIHITSDTDISVIFRTPDGDGRESDDAYLAIPTTGLGKEYYVMSYKPDDVSFFAIVAVEDNTNVYIGVTSVTLNRGETFQRISSIDLTGTFIKADKPIAVISGSHKSFIPPSVWASDTLLEEMIPVERWGTDYYTAPLYSPNSGDQVRIIASEDGTVIDIDDGVNISRFTLPLAGNWIELEVEPAVHITSQKPIFVVQYARGKMSAGVGDPFEMGIIPTDGFDTRYIFYTPPGYTYTEGKFEIEGNFATIIAPEDETRVTLDSSVIQSGWYPMPGGGKYIIAPVSVGEHVINADNPVGVYAHGYRDFGSYGYPAGFCFECLSPEDSPVNLPPIIDIGQDQTVFTEPEDEDGDTVVIQTASISDPEGDIVEYSWSIDGVIVKSGSIDTPDDGSPILLTLEVEMKVTHSSSTLTLTISDGINELSDEAFITVIDATPPKMKISVTPDILFPPNHKLVEIEVAIDVKDNADPNPSVVLTSIACNESDNIINGGDGNTTDDIQSAGIGTEDTEFLLRAERRGDGIGRFYLITYTATDESGNSTSADAIITVPHDKGKRSGM